MQETEKELNIQYLHLLFKKYDLKFIKLKSTVSIKWLTNSLEVKFPPKKQNDV